LQWYCMQKQLQCERDTTERDSCISLTLQLLSSLPDLPSFPQLPWNSRIFVCFHVSHMKWLSSSIFKLKLNLSRFLPVGQLLPFIFICTMFNIFFLPSERQYPEKSWEVLKMCVSIAYQKETKSWETPEPEERYFLPFGKEERRIKFHIFIAWTHKVCASKKAEEKPRKGNFLAIWGTQISKFPPGRANLRKLPSRIKCFKTWQVCTTYTGTDR
jgi:hypothetical protein